MKIDNSGNVIYRCTTDELAKQFLQECEEQGILWGDSGEKPTTNYNVWRIYKHRTCFSFENGRLLFGTIGIIHSVIEYLGKDTKSTEELQAEIARLTEENERLTAENVKIDEYRCVIDDISEQCRELEAENAELTRKVRELESQNASLRA